MTFLFFVKECSRIKKYYVIIIISIKKSLREEMNQEYY